MSLNCIKDIDNYALTGHTSRYNEDGLTAQQLLIKCAKRVKECINVCEMLHNNNYFVDTSLQHNPVTEELTIVAGSLFKATAYVNRFYMLFRENSKSQIELASSINLAINECLTVLNKTATNIKELVDSNELLKLIDNCNIEVFDDCSMTLLELAGNTAKNVNELITIINTLEGLAKDMTVTTYDSDSEEYATFIKSVSGEELNI